MAVKELFTRIALKYDEYKNWMDPEKGGKLVLLKGEIGLCEVPTTATGDDKATNAPTVLFKVGDGTKTFSELQWASAKAADVYSWAKASDVVYNENAKTITFVKGNEDGTDKVFTFNYVTATEVDAQIKAITDGISSKVTALEGKFGETGEVTAALANHKSRLDIIEGEGDGSIKKAAQEAQAAITDTIGGSYNSTDTVDKAIKAAKQAADNAQEGVDELTKENGRIAKVESKATDLEGRLDSVETFFEVAEGESLNEALDTLKEIQDYLGGEGNATDGIIGRVAQAEKDIDAIEKDFAAGGRVTKAEGEITGLKSRVDTVEDTVLTGADSNANLRSAITTLQKITGDNSANGNAKLREDITTLANQINATNTGILAKLTSAESKLSAIEGNYLKADDAYIFQCGNASTPNHLPE